MKTILAIDTSGEACSASLLYKNHCYTKFEIAPQAHSQLVLQMCADLLAETEITLSTLDAVAFCRGPGSFTGLRIGAGIIQGLAYSHDLPVIRVSALKALAQAVVRTDKSINVLSIIDARMNEVYWAQYFIDENAVINDLGEEKLSAVEDLPSNITSPLIGAGSGWIAYRDRLNNHLKYSEYVHISNYQHVSAEDIVILAANKHDKGEWVTPEEALPVYLRNDVVHKR